MKNVATTLAGRVGSTIVVLLLLVGIHIMGCGETEDPLESTTLAENTEVGVFAGEKYYDSAPGAPSAPQGTPFVKEVGFYHDWRLTKPITAPVAVGKTIFIKVVFSEPMRHVVSDGKESRPLLYYRRVVRDAPLVKFNMADHGAGGADFLPGDAKPLQSGTDDYICKYKVVPEDEGKQISFMVGKFSVDLEGNPLSAFYRYPIKLQVQEPAPVVEEGSEPEPEVEVNDIPTSVIPIEVAPTPPTPIVPREVEMPVTHDYYNGVAISDILPPSAWVLEFPGPFRHHYPPRSNPTDFVGRVAMPVDGADYANWASEGSVAPVSDAIVTITSGTRRGEQVMTDNGGYYLFRDVTENELYLRVEKAYLEPKEVIVSRSRATTLQRMGRNRVFIAQHHAAERTPGTILMGLRWPEPVRFILKSETLPHDPLCTTAIELPNQIGVGAAGTYNGASGVITVINVPEWQGELDYGVFAHELAHARQQAVAMQHGNSNIDHWENTPEAQAYRVAWEKDLAEIPFKDWVGTLDKSDYYTTDLLENAAEFCSYYWMRDRVAFYEIVRGGGIQKRSPNRFKWAQTYLNTRY